MIYIFNIDGTRWIKIGYTSHENPWLRVTRGFWTNSHPTELCDCLSDVTLLHAFEGGLELEATIKRVFPPDHGEFWYAYKLPNILQYLMEQGIPEFEDDWEPVVPEPDEKLPCCGGRPNVCYRCHRSFARWQQLQRHITYVHMKARHVQCRKCGKIMYDKHYKRHQGICK